MRSLVVLFIISFSTVIAAQNKDAFNSPNQSETTSFLDPSKFSVNHSMSFGMASGTNWGGIKSQSLYSTMMQYKFSEPVTLNLNFSLPIYSSFSSAQNLTGNNLESMEYFQNVPFDVSLTWKVRKNMLMQFSVIRSTPDQIFGTTSNYDLFGDPIKKY